MPTYEYRCKRCGEQFELVQSFSAKPLKRHECGGDLQKVFHPRGVMFKGSGFYSTDSRSSGKVSAGKPSGESKPSSEPGPSSDSKKPTDTKSSGDSPPSTKSPNGAAKAKPAPSKASTQSDE